MPPQRPPRPPCQDSGTGVGAGGSGSSWGRRASSPAAMAGPHHGPPGGPFRQAPLGPGNLWRHASGRSAVLRRHAGLPADDHSFRGLPAPECRCFVEHWGRHLLQAPQSNLVTGSSSIGRETDSGTGRERREFLAQTGGVAKAADFILHGDETSSPMFAGAWVLPQFARLAPIVLVCCFAQHLIGERPR